MKAELETLFSVWKIEKKMRFQVKILLVANTSRCLPCNMIGYLKQALQYDWLVVVVFRSFGSHWWEPIRLQGLRVISKCTEGFPNGLKEEIIEAHLIDITGA